MVWRKSKDMKKMLSILAVAIAMCAFGLVVSAENPEYYKNLDISEILESIENTEEVQEARVVPCCDANYKLEWVFFNMTHYAVTEEAGKPAPCILHLIWERQVCKKCGAIWATEIRRTEEGCGKMVL
jgi:hypothetical protein